MTMEPCNRHPTRPAARAAVGWVFLLLVCGAASTAGAETFPTYGASFDGPRGWQALSRDGGSRVARWAQVDARGTPTHLLLVDAGKPTEKTIDAAAARLAERFKGKVSERATEVDGERALRVEAEHPGRGMQPVEILVTSHDGLVYFVFGGMAQPGSCRDAIEQVRKSWKWVERQAPSASLADRVAVRRADLGLTASVPRSAALVPGMKDHPSLHLGFRDPAESAEEAMVMTQVVPMQEGAVFGQVAETFRQGWNGKQLGRADLVWKPRAGAGAGGGAAGAAATIMVSNPVLMKETGPKGEPIRVIWALRQLDDRSVAMVTTTLTTDDAEELKRYEAFAEEFVRGLEKQARGE